MDTQKWFETPRFKHLKRRYSYKDVDECKSVIPQTYSSNIMAKQLWELLEKHQAQRTYSFTFGCLDPVQF